MTDGNWNDPEKTYECAVASCDETFHNPKDCVVHEYRHTKQQTKDAIKRLLRR